MRRHFVSGNGIERLAPRPPAFCLHRFSRKALEAVKRLPPALGREISISELDFFLVIEVFDQPLRRRSAFAFHEFYRQHVICFPKAPVVNGPPGFLPEGLHVEDASWM